MNRHAALPGLKSTELSTQASKFDQASSAGFNDGSEIDCNTTISWAMS